MLLKFKRHIRLLSFLFFIVFIISGWFYYQSELLKQSADNLLKEGKAAEAIELYNKAQSTFPLRFDILDDIDGAKLILDSNRYYGQVVDFYEFQQLPPLSNLPSVRLNPNELFVPILMYHQIRINTNPSDPVVSALTVSPEQLEQQLSFLNSHNFQTITLDELSTALEGKTSLPKNPIILTFDDGYRNFYENAFPLLKKYDAKAVQFVITGVVDRQPYLTWSQIMEMDKSGLIEFGAHTRHHPNLPDIPRATIVDEIKGSKLDLEQHLKKRVNWFAYPYGSYSEFIMQTVRDAGFKGAASTVYGTAQSKNTLYLFPRIMVDGRFTLDNLTSRIER